MRTAVIAVAMATSLAAARPASADQLGIGFITCIASVSCIESDGPVYWRIINGLHLFANPEGASEDLLDVTLEFHYEGGSLSWHWDRVQPLRVAGDATETDPFDASLVRRLTLLRFSATLPRTVFDPVFTTNPRESFVAETDRITASTTEFPPPLNFYAQGDFELAPVPEPGTVALVAIGLAGMARLRRRQSS
jgi:hypothetical protein